MAIGYTAPVLQYTTTVAEVENLAILKWDDRVGEAADAANQGIRCPAGAQVEGFGAIITEAITNASAQHCVLKCQVVAYEGASAVTAGTMTLPKDSTEAQTSTNKTFPTDRTGAQAVAVGARLFSPTIYQVPPGGHVYLEITLGAGAAGGAIRGFLLLRPNAEPGAVTASPVTVLNS